MKLNKNALHDWDNLLKKRVILEVSQNDTMYSGSPTPDKDSAYLNVGYSGLKCLRRIMILAEKKGFEKILDFGCGYGRVMRMIKAGFPQAKITACDIDRDGVKFCAQIFKALPVYSDVRPQKIKLPFNYDLIWVGSVFTHLNKDKWGEFFKLLLQHLNTRGLLVFTTHGRAPARWMRTGMTPYHLTAQQLYGLEVSQFQQMVRSYDQTGFGYVEYKHLPNQGISLTSPSWVLKQLERFTNIRLISYTECGWGQHHDVIGLVKFP